MKNFFYITSLILFIFFTILLITLSTTGYETTRFNKIISQKINSKNKNISLKLLKIKFKLDIKKVSLFLETENPILNYQNLNVPIKNIKVYVDFISLIKAKPKIDKINISSKEINIDLLKKIFLKTKPSNLNSLVTNKIINGKLIANIELYFDNNLNIKNFITKGKVKDMQANMNSEFILKKTSFNFFSDNTDTLITNIKSKTDGFTINNGDIKVEKKKNIIVQSSLSTNVNINKKNINNYKKYFKNIKYINKQTNLKANLTHNLKISFDNTYKVTDYIYKSIGNVDNIELKLNQPIKSTFLKNNINNISFKESDLNFRLSSDEKNYIKINGEYRFNKNEYNKYTFINNFLKGVSNIDVDFEFAQKINFDLINYTKKKKIAKISSTMKVRGNSISFYKIDYSENKNAISVRNLKIKKNDLVSLEKIKVKTLNNDFSLDFGKTINLRGKKYDAKNLNKFLNKKSKVNILKKISKRIEIDLKHIETPLSKKLKNFKLLGVLEKGKFVKISSKGDFGNNKYLDITLKSDKSRKKKYLEIYSDLPQPLLTEYDFFKGLSEGTLIFSSIIEGDQSNSNLKIENFKIINAPGVVKLLSLADFGGLADLAEGGGLSFKKLEIKISEKKNHLILNELYAVGPSISVLMDGYIEANGLVSLKGTLVPAKNLNKILSKIPVIGNIIIPKEVGEGLFGVSFKMKGQPKKIKTTINPIKTLTPRFITKALEKSKKYKKSK